MGYKCGNCNIEFPNKRAMIEHMIIVHNSPFVEGEYAEASDKILDEMKKTELKEKVLLARVI